MSQPMILAMLSIVTDSEACVSAQAHFPFRCKDLKLFDASSVLAMDEKQSLALSNCRLKKEDAPGLGGDLQCRTATVWARTRASRSNSSSRNSSVRMACRGHSEAKTRDRNKK